MKIADFFGSVGFKVDIRPLDDALNKVEGRLNRFVNHWNGRTLSLGARINSVALNKSITETFKAIQTKRVLKFNATIDKIKIDKSIVGNAIKAANLKLSNIKVSGKTAAINLDNFKINTNSLKTSLMSAIAAVEKQVQINLNVNARTGRVSNGSVSNAHGSSNSRGMFGGLHSRFGFDGIEAASLLAYGPQAAGVASAVYAFHRWNETNNQMNGIKNTIRAVTDSPEEANSTEKFLKQTSMENGLDYIALAHPAAMTMASARRTKMKGQPTLDLIKAVSEYGSVMQLDSSGIEGTFRALYQMMSKGQVMSEEVKRQLDEHLPGAEQIFAEAYSKLTKKGHGTGDEADVMQLLKAMKAGKVIPAELLPIVTPLFAEAARKGGALDAARNSPRAVQTRFHNQLYNFSEEFGAAGGNQGAAKIYTTLSKIVEGLRGNVDKLAKAFNWLADRISNLVDDTATLVKWMGKLWDGLKDGEKQALKFNAVLLLLARNPLFAAFTAFYLVLEDIGTYFAGGDSILGRLLKAFPDIQNAFDPLQSIFSSFKDLLGDVFTLAKDFLDTLVQISQTDIFKGVIKSSFDSLLASFKSLHMILSGLHEFFSGKTVGDRAGGLLKMGQGVTSGLVGITQATTGVLGRTVGENIGEQFKYHAAINPNLTAAQNARDYVSDMRMRGNKLINGPSPNIVINSDVTVNGGSPDMYKEIEQHINDVWRKTIPSYPEGGA